MYKIICRIHICGRNTAYSNQRPSRLWAFSPLGGRAVPDSPPLRAWTQYPTGGGAQHTLAASTNRWEIEVVYPEVSLRRMWAHGFPYPLVYSSIRSVLLTEHETRVEEAPMNMQTRYLSSGRLWSQQPDRVLLVFLGTWQPTDHQQSSLQVATFWLAFHPLRSVRPPCESVLQLTISVLESPAALYVLWLYEVSCFLLFF